MPFQVDLTNDDDQPLQKVRITIECTPQCADWILALSVPLALNGNFAQSALALPEALIMLAEFLEQTDLPAEHWSQASRNLVEHFIRDMSAYSHTIHFNYRDWLENFTSELDRMHAKIGTEGDQKLFDAIRFVTEQIAGGTVNHSQISLYCNAAGASLDFRNWADRVLENSQSPWVIESAHLSAFDADRLIEMIKMWKEVKPGSSLDDEIPF